MAVRLTISYPPRHGGRRRAIETDTYDTRTKAMRDLRDEFYYIKADDDATFCLALAAERDVLVKFEEI